MSENRNILIKRRSSCKARLTAFTTFLNKLQDGLADKNLTDLQIIELEQRLERVRVLIDDYENIQTDIELLSENVDEQYAEREKFEQNYYQVMSQASDLLHKSKPIQGPPSDTDRPVDSLSNQLNNIKLPTIQLPKFSGSYETWLEFRDTFDSLIHNNISINNIQKFHYLRASLTDDASQVINSLEFTEANYAVAWSILCERFNNNRLLINNHIKAIFNLEPIVKESAPKLRKLVDNVSKHLRSLEQLKQPTTHWDILIIYIITSKLDHVTIREWEASKTDDSTLEEFKKFIRNRADLLETIQEKQPEKTFAKNNAKFTNAKTFLSSTVTCSVCNKNHQIFKCAEFLNLPVHERISKVKSLKLCVNCLRSEHKRKGDCTFGSCKKCTLQHNSLLHIDNIDTGKAESVSLASVSMPETILLSTAMINIIDRNGHAHKIRALLDSGSQSSFIKADICHKLDLQKTNVNLTIGGINNGFSSIKHKCIIEIASVSNKFHANLSCFVLDNITGNIPNTRLDNIKLNIPTNIKLADPNFNSPGEIHILIGADLFWNLLCIGQIKLGKQQPILQKTRLGWVVAGPIYGQQPALVQCNLSHTLNVQDQLAMFWEIENIPVTKPLSVEENMCENHFAKNTSRNTEGRFIVKIPFKHSIDQLGDSKEQAQRRFFSLERKLQSNKQLREKYISFMLEYQRLGHMSLVTNQDSKAVYYLPHHGVLNEKSLTTKLRVVFDGSAATSSGKSINDIQGVGPVIQCDLFSILIRFRQHTYAISADIEKMYRQVLVAPDDRSFQRIFWRENPTDPLNEYELNTVTYGTASASFLAIRCLNQLADECLDPKIAKIISRDFYVDDLLSGAETVAEAADIARKISDVLNSGCFPLRKWHSSSTEVERLISNSGDSMNLIDLGSNSATKTLGLIWSCRHDYLTYNTSTIKFHAKDTKRSILSAISQIFDPLGLLGPAIITVKILLQKLWLEKLSWDESLPFHIHTVWCKFKSELSCLDNIQIPRHAICKNFRSVQIHGFSDASENAYGACIYLRSESYTGQVIVNLLCSKSRVAPLKPLTVPRLELCGALLLTKLTSKVKSSLQLSIQETVLWTDSTIVLGWLKTAPNLLKTFVASRVAEIQDITCHDVWRHVPTKENPADVLSRGVSPEQISDIDIWWHGPSWLAQAPSQWPKSEYLAEKSELEMRKVHSFHSQIETSFPFERYSNLNKLKHIVAYVIRFFRNCKTPASQRVSGPLTCQEVENAFQTIIKLIQIQAFPQDYSLLASQKPLKSKGKLLSLNPFLDEHGIIRVGGRLGHSQFEYDKRNPKILPSNNHITELIVKQEHVDLFHGGTQLTLSSLREKFWPISGRNTVKGIIRKCVTCCRYNPKIVNPIMGDLPRNRITQNFPFSVSGVDYAGPLSVKDRKGRGSKISKCWVCLFICFITKAIHVELVSELTTEAFLAALRRFVARRGKPAEIYSDNGTNFKGANAEMLQLINFLKENQTELHNLFTDQGIKWHFIPPQSPHFGGIWEAGVKSVKHHLKRVLGNRILTFESLYTVLVQIESVLNSRPLSTISCDPKDPLPLTPAHFLIGRLPRTIPEADLHHLPENKLSHFQQLQQVVQHFWERWSKEYISELQQRSKWKLKTDPLKENSIVLIKEDNQPPMKWKLGRILELHPGKDGIPRVASIQTSSGIIRRGFQKVCPLPVESGSFQGRGHVTA